MRRIGLPEMISCVLAGCLLLNATGCKTAPDASLTHQLWNNERLGHHYEPAPNPRLELFQDERRGDVLATYDEVHDVRATVRRRAYFVNRNRARIEAARKPRFVDPELARGLQPIPLAPAMSAVPSNRALLQAVVSTNGQQFTLSGDFCGHIYTLPVYEDQSGLVAKLVLLPIAVTGDAVVVGTVAGVVWLYSGAPGWRR